MFTTYNSLITQVQNTLDRVDASTQAQIPYFIYQAEIKLCELVKTTGVLDYVTGVFIPGVSVYQYPARWRRTISLNYGNGNNGALHNNYRNQIKPRSYEYVREYWPDSTKQSSAIQPIQFFADYGFYNFLVAPTPDQAYPFELAFMGLPEPLTVANQTNWFTNFAPNALFYATMLEAVIYLKDYETIPAWEAKFKEASGILQGTDDYRKVTRQNDRDAD